MDEPTDAQPRFTVLRGQPDAEELAALTAVLCACLRAPAQDGDGDGAQEAAAEAAPWGGRRRHRPRVGWTSHT
ncbi:acyl-CoA carboxylase subunit epsilon [Streptomyces sp. ISL-43]|uniref:acyl-CoA carboxylase subunit epsilon n=1 Tax=Streptomyces sp. ISL-43 TaxID=2819183 RepID=UPI001BEBE3C4|nr:acyl-CoA carboxylase subunit epsilon [Streptomyces sp. ISL-43]MBT2447912.1 acyl-CoA carboxylase subunit epsilon [Streptomyces sp. ISL-43]